MSTETAHLPQSKSETAIPGVPVHPHGRGWGRRASALLMPLILPAALLVAWYLSTTVLHLFEESQLPRPMQVVDAAREAWDSGDLTRHLSASAVRVGMGFAIGSLLALVVGILVGLSRTAERLIDPTLQALRNVPSLAWVPFLLLWLGIDETPKITLIAIGTFFPVYINVVTGIRQVDRKLLEVGAIFGLGPVGMVQRIYLPGSLPYIVAGVRIGAGQAWLFLVAAELIASTKGFGFMLIDGQNSMRPDLMLVAILSLALLGKITDSVLRLVERRLLRWSDTKANGR